MAKPVRFRASPALVEMLRNLHPGLKRRVRAAMDRIAGDATAGKALRAELEGQRSLRIGRFRLVYRLPAGRIVELVAFGPRAAIYEETLRLLRNEDA